MLFSVLECFDKNDDSNTVDDGARDDAITMHDKHDSYAYWLLWTNHTTTWTPQTTTKTTTTSGADGFPPLPESSKLVEYFFYI